MKKKPTWKVLFITSACCLGLLLSHKPWAVYQEQKIKLQNTQKELKDFEIKRSKLVRRKLFYDSPVGQELLARNRGYHRASELPLN